MAVASWSLLSCAFSNWEIFYWKMAFSLIPFSFFLFNGGRDYYNINSLCMSSHLIDARQQGANNTRYITTQYAEVHRRRIART